MFSRLLSLLIVAAFANTLTQWCYAQDSENRNSASDAKPQTMDELLLFFPAKFPTGDWKPHGLHFEDVYFSAEDGTKLHGWYCPCDNPRGVLLLAHGNYFSTLATGLGRSLNASGMPEPSKGRR